MARQSDDTPAASLVAIGLSGDEIEARLAEATAKVVLVEPDPARAASIEAHYKGRPGLIVIAAAVANEAGQADLSEFNLSGLRSLHPPTPAMKTRIPGLCVTARHPVQVITPEALLAQAGDLPRPAHLRINAAGCEYVILQGLQRAGALERFTRIWVRCGAEAMFEQARDSATVQHWMQSRGFSLAEVDETDPDWPELCFRAGPVSSDLPVTQHKLAALEQRLARASAELEEKDARLNMLEAMLTLAQADLATARRMQAVAQADLHDLQERYKRSEKTRAEQSDLLQRLTPCLQLVAQQLRSLAEEDKAGGQEKSVAVQGELASDREPGNIRAVSPDHSMRKDET